ncbi:Hypothetical predicted protein [Pelobates cultripes]|uniref:Uncharacterized protein n=1 Tax=Pelobates cultripes TaxID=61616 RepID=A0AAD1SWY1_PELCU|nr:Hypothetical predicted protein [Pelobates cultripes]
MHLHDTDTDTAAHEVCITGLERELATLNQDLLHMASMEDHRRWKLPPPELEEMLQQLLRRLVFPPMEIGPQPPAQSKQLTTWYVTTVCPFLAPVQSRNPASAEIP